MSVLLLISLMAIPQLAERSTDAAELQDGVARLNADGLRFDVIASKTSVGLILGRLAEQSRRTLSIEPGDAELRCKQNLDFHLRDRSLSDCLGRIGEAAGLHVDLRLTEAHGGEIRVRPAEVQFDDSERLLRRALKHSRIALLETSTPEAEAKIRYEMGNLQYRLGDDEAAIEEYSVLVQDHPGFAVLPMARYRTAHAYARLGNDGQAVETWLALAHETDGHPLVVPSYLHSVRAFRRMGGKEANAKAALRSVVEVPHQHVPPSLIVEAAELLREGGEAQRSVMAYQKALERTQRTEIRQQALSGLVGAYSDLQDWPEMLRVARQYIKAFPAGAHRAEMYLQVGVAHYHMKDPFVTLQAVRQASMLSNDSKLIAECGLWEGRIYAEIGHESLAAAALSRVAHSEHPRLALDARLRLAAVHFDHGRMVQARETYDGVLQDPRFSSAQAEAHAGLARVAFATWQWQQAIEHVQDALLDETFVDRGPLRAIASESMRRVGTDVVAEEGVDQ